MIVLFLLLENLVIGYSCTSQQMHAFVVSSPLGLSSLVIAYISSHSRYSDTIQ
jgi:hypothetical protein